MTDTTTTAAPADSGDAATRGALSGLRLPQLQALASELGVIAAPLPQPIGRTSVAIAMESGGQIGDHGKLSSLKGFAIKNGVARSDDLKAVSPALQLGGAGAPQLPPGGGRSHRD